MTGSIHVDGNRRVLLVNPPIADTVEVEQQDMVTAVEPFGLLRLATHFRDAGCAVDYLDCLRDPALEGRLRRHVRKVLPCGNLDEEGISKEIHHFGLDATLLGARLRSLPAPDVIGIGSIFTWHGDPVREAVEVCRSVFPRARIVVGGNVATLCPDEAARFGADEVFRGDVDGAVFAPTAADLIADRYTDFLRMIKGCPNRCSYCVTHCLNDDRVVARPPGEVFDELVAKKAANGTRNFILYDDYVLYRQGTYLDPLLDRIAEARLDIALEFALGFAANKVTGKLADRLRAAGVERVILALETLREEESRAMHRPHHVEGFVRAVELLKARGFKGRNLRAFYLIGLPNQTTDEILRAILFLYSLGVTPSLTTYTLTPRSGDMARYGHLAKGRALDELGPCLWRFAHPGMRVRELDAIYRYFHEKFFPLSRIMASSTADPVICAMQEILRNGRHQPEKW